MINGFKSVVNSCVFQISFLNSGKFFSAVHVNVKKHTELINNLNLLTEWRIYEIQKYNNRQDFVNHPINFPFRMNFTSVSCQPQSYVNQWETRKKKAHYFSCMCSSAKLNSIRLSDKYLKTRQFCLPQSNTACFQLPSTIAQICGFFLNI